MNSKNRKPRSFSDVWIRGLTGDPAGRTEIRDTVKTGLAVRVTPRGAKTFVHHTRSPDGKTIRLTIGRYPVFSLKLAREKCQENCRLIAAGIDPREHRKEARSKTLAAATKFAMLLDEAEEKFSPTLVVWRENGRPGRQKPEAKAAIENVYADLLHVPICQITLADLTRSISSYRSLKPRGSKTTANGAVSRAMNYLRTVSNWSAGRKPFEKLGSGRDPVFQFPDLAKIHDPSASDPAIVGTRDRVVSQQEIVAIMPLLTYPAPKGSRKSLDRSNDYTPIAMKFPSLTMSRVDEVSSARPRDLYGHCCRTPA